MKDKIITFLLTAILALSGWSLSTTIGLKTDVAILKEKMSKVESVISKIGKKQNKKHKKKKKND
jgi:outer membrane lipoprotein-sorting protein|tara:strand:+ start:230 stop:421 length:192 start_codon:yes stop_codon:yes gene_type:complete